MGPIVPIAENCRVLLHTLEARIGEAAWRDTGRAAEQGDQRCTVLEETGRQLMRSGNTTPMTWTPC
jgi:hypothetical protein